MKQLLSLGLSALLLLLFYATPAQAQTKGSLPQSEYNALLDLYQSTHGDSWLPDYRWNLSADPETWFGVLIEEGHVVGLSLYNVGLTGTLPPSLFTAFPKLVGLDVSNNRLEGPIPADLNRLTSLKALYIGDNLWSGAFPKLDKLVNLEYLGLNDFLVIDKDANIITHVEGELPDLSLYPKLVYVDASYSAFRGSISPNIGACRNLTVLELTGNLLTGSLPSSLNQCTELQILSVQINQLSGEIPDLSNCYKLGSAPEGDVGRLYLSNNKFTGAFPGWVAQLAYLERFSCAGNDLSGEMPQDLSGMANAKAFFIDHNRLSGSLPAVLPPALEEFDASHNLFSGSLPTGWSSSKELNHIILSHNNLSGEVSALFKKLRNLDNLNVEMNRFSLADWKAWTSFAADDEVNFRFGSQQAYSEPQEVQAHAGHNVSVKAPYPGTLIGDERYEWFNLSTGAPVTGQNSATLTLGNVAKEQAALYVCLVTSPSLSVPAQEESAELRSQEEEPSRKSAQELVNPTQPTLMSGVVSLYVDGYIQELGVLPPSAQAACTVYPTTLTGSELLHFTQSQEIASVALFAVDGTPIAPAAPLMGEGYPLPHLAPGTYLVLMQLKDDSHRVTPIIIR